MFSKVGKPFKISQGELIPENLTENPEWVADGRITDQGLTMLREQASGTFVDVGCHLPFYINNTLLLEERGWRGIALDIVGLSERAKHYPRELSGGQEQRVAIARAIVSDPALLLCDEPTGDLDRETADEILRLLQTLNREHGKTIVMVTHDAQAAEYANRTLHCDKGTLESREAA